MKKSILSSHRSRRQFLRDGAWAFASLTVVDQAVAATLSGPKLSDTVTIVNFAASGAKEGTVQLPRVSKTEAEWRSQLSELSFQVTRKEATEAPFTGEYVNNHAKGIYRCICCDTALFDASTKFESGTGWPSFYQPISRTNITEKSDRSLGMDRTAVSCKLCDAHLGHVFQDGPQPTGLRYCMNSVSLHFVARA